MFWSGKVFHLDFIQNSSVDESDKLRLTESKFSNILWRSKTGWDIQLWGYLNLAAVSMFGLINSHKRLINLNVCRDK